MGKTKKDAEMLCVEFLRKAQKARIERTSSIGNVRFRSKSLWSI
jgi:hypothetical protein